VQEKESEVRRRRLLEENRRRQRNTGMSTPAIHPRYGRLYRELYPDGLEQSAGNGAEDLDKKENSRGSFTTRLILSTFLFLVFLYVSQNSVELQGINSHEIIEMIQENHDIFLID
jgi:hypothetical protein